MLNILWPSFLIISIIYAILSGNLKNINNSIFESANSAVNLCITLLGRVVIPIEIRNQFNIIEKDPIEIYVDDSSIILKKYEPDCIFCGNTEDLIEYKGKLVCKNCSDELNILQKK